MSGRIRKSSRRCKQTKRSRRARTRRTRRSRRGGAPYPATRMMPLASNQTLGGGYFSRANQIGGSLCKGGTLQPSGTMMNAGCSNGQVAIHGAAGGRL